MRCQSGRFGWPVFDCHTVMSGVAPFLTTQREVTVANNPKRSRGRGRKPGNNANRSYESNGPDVKIRGNASHISEKYQQLARDAAASGDRVAAENYLQHAEHYYRLVLAAQQQSQEQREQREAQRAASDSDGDGDTDAKADGDKGEGGNRRRSRRRRDTVKEKTEAGADNAGNREDGDKTASGDGDAEVEVIRPAKAAPADSDEDNLAETA